MASTQEIAYTIGSVAGQLAQAYAPDTSVGRAGGVGASLNQALLIQKQQEEERKKQKKAEKGGLFGTIGAAAGTVLGFTVGGPAGAAVGSAAGGALGKELGGSNGFELQGLASDAFSGYGSGVSMQGAGAAGAAAGKQAAFNPDAAMYFGKSPYVDPRAVGGSGGRNILGGGALPRYTDPHAQGTNAWTTDIRYQPFRPPVPMDGMPDWNQPLPQGYAGVSQDPTGQSFGHRLMANARNFLNHNLTQRRQTTIDPATGNITIKYGGNF